MDAAVVVLDARDEQIEPLVRSKHTVAPVGARDRIVVGGSRWPLAAERVSNPAENRIARAHACPPGLRFAHQSRNDSAGIAGSAR